MTDEFRLLGHLLNNDFRAALVLVDPVLAARVSEIEASDPDRSRACLEQWEKDFLEVCEKDLACLRQRWRDANFLRSFSFDGLSDLESQLASALSRFCKVWQEEINAER